MSTGGAVEGAPSSGVSVGVAAARLGITASTLRSWGRRYGVEPSLRSAGGHRRYSRSDLAGLDRLQAQIRIGAAPAAAAALALHGTGTTSPLTPGPRRRGGGAGSGSRVLPVPGAGRAARGLARATGQLDVAGAEELVLHALQADGVVRCWEDLVHPVLVAVGRRWAESSDAIELEHGLSEAVLGALRRRAAQLPTSRGHPPVLLAAAPMDQHTLSLHAVAVGLAELARPSLVIGAEVPVATLASAARRVRPAAVFVSCVLAGAGDPSALAGGLPRSRPATRLVLGGGGWPSDLPPGVRHAADLGQALALLR